MAHQIDDSDYYAVLCNRIKMMENRFFCLHLITTIISIATTLYMSSAFRFFFFFFSWFFLRDKLSVYYYALFAFSFVLISVYYYLCCVCDYIFYAWHGMVRFGLVSCSMSVCACISSDICIRDMCRLTSTGGQLKLIIANHTDEFKGNNKINANEIIAFIA